MAQAYDFALDKIGMDIHSYPIWNDYVNFLKGVEAIGSYAENQKISAVRKVYQKRNYKSDDWNGNILERLHSVRASHKSNNC